RLAVDRPMVEVFLVPRNLADQHFELMIGLRSRAVIREHGVIPRTAWGSRGILPLRIAGLASILHDYTHSHLAFVFLHRTENPYARILHFDKRIDTLANVQIEPIHGLLPGNRIAVHRDDSELVARKRESNLI